MIFKTTNDGGLTNIFKELKSVQTAFEELDKSTLRSVIKAFNNTSLSVNDLSDKFGVLDDSVINYLNTAKRGKASINEFSKTIDTSASSMVSAAAKAKLLSVALNALTGLAISLAFEGISWAIDELIVTLDEQKEKLDKALISYEESRTELENINEELKTATERIDELNSKDNLTFTEQDELERLVKTNDELERKIYLLEQANKEAEKEVAIEAQNTYDKYINNRTIGAVEQIDFYANSSLLDGVNWDNFKGDLSWLVAQYQNQEKILEEAQNKGWENIEAKARFNLELLKGYMSDASLNYQDLYDDINGISDDSITDELKFAKQDLNDILNIVAKILGYDGKRSETYFDDIWNSDSFYKYKTELIKLSKEGKLEASVLESNENYKVLLEDTGSTAEDTAQHINALVEAEENAKDAISTDETSLSFTDIFSMKDTEGTATLLSDLSDKLSEVETAYNTCLTAKEEYDSQGYLSIDTLQKVLSLGDEYLQYLFDEEGNVRLDAEAFQQLALARINAMEAQALSNLADNIKQITNEATATEYLAQKQNELASSYADVAASALMAMTSISGFSDSKALQGAYDSFKAQYEQIKSLFAGTRNNLSSTYSGKASSKSSSSSTDPIKEAFTHEYNALKHNLEMEYITEKQYYDSLDVLNQKYFAGKEKYLDEYRKYEEEVYKGLQSYYKDFIESYMDFQQKSLEKCAIDYNTYSNTVSNLLKSMFKDGKIAAKDYYDYTKQLLENQLSIYDKAISGMVYVLDEEIDRLKLEKETIESNYQIKIDAIQEEIDALEKVNQERQDQIELEKAQYDLNKAINQRTQKLYTDEHGFIYTPEGSAIRDAQDVLTDKKNEIAVSKLESKIESLEKAMESELDAVEKQIEKYEEYKKQIQDVADAYENAENVKYTLAVTGLNSETEILQCRVDVLNDFKNQYISIQQAIADAAWASANEQIKAAQEAQKAASGATNTASKINTSQSQQTTSSTTISTVTWGVCDSSTKMVIRGGFSSSGEATSWAAANGYSVSSVNTSTHTVFVSKKKTQAVSSSSGGGGKYLMRTYGDGTTNAEKGWHLTSEDGDEIVIDNDNNASLLQGEQLYNFKGGETVINATDTERIIKNTGNVLPLDEIGLTGLNGEIVRFNAEELQQRLFGIMPDYSSMIQMPVPHTQRYDVTPVSRDNSTNVSIGNIHLHEVQNVDSFAKAIIRELPGKVSQAVNRR